MPEMTPKSSEKITCECGYVLSKGNLARHKRERTHKLLIQEKNVYVNRRIEKREQPHNQ